MANNKFVFIASAVLAIFVFKSIAAGEYSQCEYDFAVAEIAASPKCKNSGFRRPVVVHCEKDGTYSLVQCRENSDICCSANSRTGVNRQSFCVEKPEKPILPTTELSNCQKRRSEAFKSVYFNPWLGTRLWFSIPTCEEDGSYSPVQKIKGGIQHCCADPNNGTLTDCAGVSEITTQTKRPNCSIYEYSKCDIERAIAGEKTYCGMTGVSVPQCEKDGSFSPIQCRTTGFCCCVNPQTGEGESHCTKAPKMPKCDKEEKKVDEAK